MQQLATLVLSLALVGSFSHPRAGEPSIVEDELDRAHWVSGRVVLPPDAPPGESIVIEADGREFEHREKHRCEVAADGSFRVAFSKKTRRGSLRVQSRLLYDAGRVPIDVRNVEEPVVIELALGGRIEGVLTLDDIRAEELAALDRDPLVLSLATDAATFAFTKARRLEFSFDGLAPTAAYNLGLHSELFLDQEGVPLAVVAGQTTRCELDLKRGFRVDGVIRTADGKPPEDVWLQYRVDADPVPNTDRESSPDQISQSGKIAVAEDGSFSQRGLPLGTLVLTADAPDWLYRQVQVGRATEGGRSDGMELVLEVGGRISGRVLQADGEPAAGVDVMLRADGQPEMVLVNAADLTRRLKTNAQGRFEFSGMGPWPYELWVSEGRRGERSTEAVPVADGDELELTLD